VPNLWIDSAGFFFGLLFGSFLNVCIARLPRGESIVKPRSRCPHCGHAIRWYDNIPVLSWILLRGRCRDCGQPISPIYPAVELATGAWFAIAASRIGHILLLNRLGPNPLPWDSVTQAIIGEMVFATLGFLLIGLLVMDWRTYTLPDAFTLTGIAIALFLICSQAIFLGPTQDQVLLQHKAPITAAMSVERGNVFLTGPEALIGGRMVAVLAAAAILLLIRAAYKRFRNREGMGLGDVKLLAMIAAFLGFWPAILALFLGVFTGAVYGVFQLARGRAGATSRLPFGSFLAAGGLLAALFGDTLIDKYMSLFR
jgi:leader peptidase (prepilin peptidase)/N-methyltransferase